MTPHDLETRPRPFPQTSTVCVPGHGTAVATHVQLIAAMTLEVIKEHAA
jgi:hypothetical protein